MLCSPRPIVFAAWHDRSTRFEGGKSGNPLRDAEALVSFIKMEDGLLNSDQVSLEASQSVGWRGLAHPEQSQRPTQSCVVLCLSTANLALTKAGTCGSRVAPRYVRFARLLINDDAVDEPALRASIAC